MANLEVQTFKSITEIDPEIWNRVVANRGFQSHNWYKFGERAMACLLYTSPSPRDS